MNVTQEWSHTLYIPKLSPHSEPRLPFPNTCIYFLHTCCMVNKVYAK